MLLYFMAELFLDKLNLKLTTEIFYSTLFVLSTHVSVCNKLLFLSRWFSFFVTVNIMESEFPFPLLYQLICLLLVVCVMLLVIYLCLVVVCVSNNIHLNISFALISSFPIVALLNKTKQINKIYFLEIQLL